MLRNGRTNTVLQDVIRNKPLVMDAFFMNCLLKDIIKVGRFQCISLMLFLIHWGMILLLVLAAKKYTRRIGA